MKTISIFLWAAFRLACLAFGVLAIAGNAGAALTINSVTLNGGASVTVAPGASITVVVSETNTGGSNWRSVEFQTNPATGTSCINTPDHNGNGTYSETFTITAPAAAGNYDASFVASSNNSCGSTLSPTYTLPGGIIVAVPPPSVVSMDRASFDPTTSNKTVSWTVVFDYAVTGVDAGDFALIQAGGASGASIASVTGSGTTWTVTANTGTGAPGTLRLDLVDNDTIVSGGLRLGGTGLGNGNFTGQSYTLLSPVCTGAFPQIFCDDFERSNAGSVGNGWTVTPANVTNCTGAAGNTGCAGIDSDIPPWTTYANPRANSTRAMFTRWNIVSVDSPVVNLAGRPAAILSFWIRRGMDTFSECPEAIGENYLVQYLASDNTWKTLAQYPSSPSAALCDGEIFTPVIQLPDDALHSGFKLRFYQPSGSGKSGSGGAPGVVGYDYWHMDNVVISEAPASSYVGAFCDNFEGGLGRWSITAEGAPTGSTIGDARIGTTDYSSASHELDLRWGYVVASTLRTDMTGVTGNIEYWVKSGGGSTNRAPDAGEDLVAEYYNSAGVWTQLAKYLANGSTTSSIYNASFVLPADAKHPGFRLRFRQLKGSGYDLDYWHVDDVCVGTIVPTADLSMTMTRTGPLIPGTNVSYALNVTNNGPGTLSGSLQVVDTLPAGLSYVSSSGSGWSCSANAQIVTCGWTGTLASGATAPTLTLVTGVALNASGTITNTATVTGTVIDNVPANNTATNTGNVIVATLIAEFHLEEPVWNGTAGEVKDTAGYAGGPFNGTVIGNPNPAPALASPARTGNPGTCGYATMPGPNSNGGAFTISGLPVSTTAGAKTSVAFWMYWDGTDSVMPIGWNQHDLWLQGGSFGFNTANSDIYGISSAGLANGWHHVVAVFTNGSVTSNQLYIDGVIQTLSQRQSTPNLATAVVSSTLQVGGWTQNTGYRFAGRIDEVMVYRDALVQADVTVLYNETHACVAAVDHYELSLPSSSIACLSSTATVTACANSSSPCTSPSAAVNGQTATLATNGGALGSTTVAFNAAGVASTTLSYPSLAVDPTTVTVTLSGEQVTAINPRKCCPDGASCVLSNSCSTIFNTAGFIFSDTLGGGVATIPTQVAGTSGGTYYLRSVRSNTTTKACEAGLTGAQAVDFAYECNNPATCYSSNLMSVNGGTATTIARNDNGSVTSFSPVSMTFDANGNAPFTFVYSDVGQVKLHAKKTLTADATKTPPVVAATLRGTSNAFVVKPFAFNLSAIKQTASPNLVNPGAADATGSKFVKAGEAFSATVTAVTSTGSTAFSYGREAVAEGVKLTSFLVGGLGLTNNPALANSAAFGAFTNGVASGTTFSWNEVGIIKLTPSVADGDYLGVGDVSGATSGNVGRFYAAQFALSNGVIGNRADIVKAGSITAGSSTLTLPSSAGVQVGDDLRIVGAGASGTVLSTTAAAVSAGGLTITLAGAALTTAASTPVYIGKFTYMGEPMSAMFTLAAKAVDGTTTLQNYTWSATAANQFAKLDPLAAVTAGSGGPLGMGAVNSAATRTPFPPCGVTPAYPCLMPAQATAGVFSGGLANITVPFTLYRGTVPNGPFALLDIGVAPQDSDGAILSAYDLDTVNVVAGANNHAKVGRSDARFGRLNLTNAYGSEQLKLPIAIEAQYWNGQYWLQNTDDHTTPIVQNNIKLSNAGVTIASLTPLGNGKWTLLLNKPSVAINTYICVDLDNGATGDLTCQATTPLSMPYLQTGAAFDKDPASRATFGIYKSRFIYLREMY
ncbi:MAG: DUF11 domain-containing protein [Sulfuricella denitrificans]|nr:DUF11 domain-containing protein [Sulfuricella denitrificans]